MYSSSSGTLYERNKIKRDLDKTLALRQSESDALEFLLASKERDSQNLTSYEINENASEHWFDQKEVDEKVKNVITKFNFHSYPDRGQRFDYLQKTLKEKWSKRPGVFNSIISFLVENSDRPTNIINLNLSSHIYSKSEETEENVIRILHYEEIVKAELMREEYKKSIIEDLKMDLVKISYSDDEELSEWSADEDEVESDNSFETCTPKRKSDLNSQNEISFKLEQRHADKYLAESAKRKNQTVNAESQIFLRSNLFPHQLRPLSAQPVIPNLTSLYTRFGEFVEWKKMNEKKSSVQLISSEISIVYEILLQFSSPSLENSLIFSKNNTFTKSISNQALHSLLTLYAKALEKLSTMKKFIQSEFSTQNKSQSDGVYGVYASALESVLNFILSSLRNIEHILELWKKGELENKPHSFRPCFTLLQLHFSISPLLPFINKLYEIHSRCTLNFNVSQSEKGISEDSDSLKVEKNEENLNTTHSKNVINEDIDDSLAKNKLERSDWLKTLQIISVLELSLENECDSSTYGLILYIFSKVLQYFLKQVLGEVNKSSCRIFSIKVLDMSAVSFWDTFVTIRSYEEELKQNSVSPMKCIRTILNKLLKIVKVVEILRQMDTQNSISPFKTKSIFQMGQQFIQLILGDDFWSNNSQNLNDCGDFKNSDICDSNILSKRPDYEGSWNIFEGNSSIESFSFVLEEENKRNEIRYKSVSEVNNCEIDDFYRINKVPTSSISGAVEKITISALDPFYASTCLALSSLFTQFKLKERIFMIQEILMLSNEEFATALISLAHTIKSRHMKDGTILNDEGGGGGGGGGVEFEELYSRYYGESELRSVCRVEWNYLSSSETNFSLSFTPLFPLSLFLSWRVGENYGVVGRGVGIVRKGLWLLNRLRLSECKSSGAVPLHRLFAVRFSLIHFWSSFRSFILLNFLKNRKMSQEMDLANMDFHELLLRCEKESRGPVFKILKFRITDAILLKPILFSTIVLCRHWKVGISIVDLTKIETRLRVAWTTVLEFSGSQYSEEMNQLSEFFSPVPSFL